MDDAAMPARGDRCVGLVVAERPDALAETMSCLAEEALPVAVLGPPNLRDCEKVAASISLFLVARLGPGDMLAVCRRIRSTPSLCRHPIIVLDDPEATGEQAALRAGADQFVSWPVSSLELGARIQALLRRFVATEAARLLKVGHLELDFARMIVTCRGRSGELTLTEIRLLELLMRNANSALSRERIREAVWGGAESIELRTIDVHVGRLRKLLLRRFRLNPIRTVRGVGYKLDESRI